MSLVQTAVRKLVTAAPNMFVGHVDVTTALSIEQLIMRAALVRCQPQISSLFQKRYGWNMERKLHLYQTRVVLLKWKTPSSRDEPRNRLLKGRLATAGIYEWLCYMASHSSDADRMLDLGNIVLLGEVYTIIQKTKDGQINVWETETLPQSKKPWYYVGHYLLVD